MNQRTERQSCTFTVYGQTADALYLAALDIARAFFGDPDENHFVLQFDAANPYVQQMAHEKTPSVWKCDVTAIAKTKVPS